MLAGNRGVARMQVKLSGIATVSPHIGIYSAATRHRSDPRFCFERHNPPPNITTRQVALPHLSTGVLLSHIFTRVPIVNVPVEALHLGCFYMSAYVLHTVSVPYNVGDAVL